MLGLERWRWLAMWAFPPLVLLMALAGGCDDGGVPATATPSTQEQGGVSPEVEDELRSILRQWGSRDARIAYKASTVTRGVREEADILFQWRPSLKQWRMDIALADGESGSVIHDGTDLYLCDDAEHACLRLLPEESPVAPLPFVADSEVLADPALVAESVLQQLRTGTTVVSSRTVADIAARCFTSTGLVGVTGALERLEVCFAVDTALLLRAEALAVPQGGQQDSSLFEATQVSGDVAADAFRPPYEVVNVTPTPSSP
ncbi:MAG TPA: hypothetical protein VNL95_02915 [Dehalococcoidia bacterium]|nr:hypothetical protein [Dehalococcoidia bacterium]